MFNVYVQTEFHETLFFYGHYLREINRCEIIRGNQLLFMVHYFSAQSSGGLYFFKVIALVVVQPSEEDSFLYSESVLLFFRQSTSLYAFEYFRLFVSFGKKFWKKPRVSHCATVKCRFFLFGFNKANVVVFVATRFRGWRGGFFMTSISLSVFFPLVSEFAPYFYYYYYDSTLVWHADGLIYW